jgi:hypothetical protein
MQKKILFIFIIIFFSSCALKKVQVAKSATIIFKTPSMKFYDKGFVNKYDNYINVQIYNLGKLALNLDIYKDKICQSTFKCMPSMDFNQQYLNNTYKQDFLYNLFNQNNIYFKDISMLIKVIYDK